MAESIPVFVRLIELWCQSAFVSLSLVFIGGDLRRRARSYSANRIVLALPIRAALERHSRAMTKYWAELSRTEAGRVQVWYSLVTVSAGADDCAVD